MTELCGIINVYKEKGYTSHDVVNIVRKSLNRVKTGHTGTLDPDAEGVLPICIGRATKLAEYIASERKMYRAELTLGAVTTTQDSGGEIIKSLPVTQSRDEIISAVKSFQGEILQVPPMYSALKVNGKRLYEIARAGGEVERKARKVTIYSIDIVEFINEKRLVIDVLCSKGTYIRTLCNDIGEKLGCGGYMSSLLRTMSGSFSIENAVKIDEVKNLAAEGRIEEILLPVENVMPDVERVTVSQAADKYLENGNKISVHFIESGTVNGNVFVYNSRNELNGLYCLNDGFLKPIVILMRR
jgi:tRNA pseudouridine55 synthase